MKKPFLIQLVGNAVLFGMVWTWLGIADAKTWQLLLTAVLGVFILGSFGILETYTLGGSWRRAAPVLGILLGAGVIIWLVSLLPIAAWAQTMASNLTLQLRTPWRPTRMLQNLQWIVWAIEWVVVPIVALPLATQAARGLPMTRPGLRWRYAAVYVVALGACVWVPWQLIHWRPLLTNPTFDIAVFTLRFLIAYLLFCAGIPVVTQPRIVDRP